MTTISAEMETLKARLKSIWMAGDYDGPTLRAFGALPTEDARAALRRDLDHLWAAHNRATDGTTHIESEYLEVAAIRQ